MQDLVVQELIETAFTATLAPIYDRAARACSIVAVKAGQRLVSYLPKVRAHALPCKNKSNYLIFYVTPAILLNQRFCSRIDYSIGKRLFSDLILCAHSCLSYFAVYSISSSTPQLIPALLQMVKGSEVSKRHLILGDVARVVDLFGIHMRPFADSLISTLREHWLSVHEVSKDNESRGRYRTTSLRLSFIIIFASPHVFSTHLHPSTSFSFPYARNV